jgi:hypothetical protein
MKSLQEYWNDWTGKTDADRAKENAMNIGQSTNAAYNDFAGAQQQGYATLIPYLLKAFEQQKSDLGQRMGLYQGAEDKSLASIQQGLTDQGMAARGQDAQRLGLIREGMGQDTATLQGFLQQILGAQAPYQQAYGSMLQASLGPLLGAMSGQSRLPVSGLAQQQLGDSSRSVNAAMQRQGLGGSGMAAAQDAAARSRIINQDQESQLARFQSMLNTAMGGANMTANAISPYASALGNMGNRLSSFNPYDMASSIGNAAKARTDLYGNTADRQAESIQQANLAQHYGTLGTAYAGQIMDPAATQMTGRINNINAQGQAGAITGPTGMSTLGELIKLYGSTQGFNRGNNQQTQNRKIG